MTPSRSYPAWLVAILVVPLATLVVLWGALALFWGMKPAVPRQQTTVTHQVVLERVKEVAKLVTAEYFLRDVVTYENTWYGSRKKSLVVVSARLLSGINLENRAQAHIIEEQKKILIRLPSAAVLAVEVTDLRTYDEQRGWWNPFTPADRDEIFQLARSQFVRTAREMRVQERAEAGAKRWLEETFSRDGYTAEVIFEKPPSQEQITKQ